jgi:hypothetical protein
MLAQVRVDVHQHLNFEGEIYPVRLRFESLVALTLHQLVLVSGP